VTDARIVSGLFSTLRWVIQNKEWLFSGVGVTIVSLIIAIVLETRRKRSRTQHQSGGAGSQNIQAGRDVNITLDASSSVPQTQEPTEGADDVLASMTQLMSEMRSDLLGPQAEFIQEFFVLPNRRVMLGGSSKPRFTYYEEDHQNLLGQIDLLEAHGFVTNVTPIGNNTLIYRMTEKLVSRLCK
jgi:hypothetical protein